MELKNPQWLEIESGGRIIYGLNQTWFGSVRKRASGCGPTAASTLLIYINRRDDGPLPYRNHDMVSAALALEDVWTFITPGILGLNSTEKFVSGMNKLLKHYGTLWSCHELKVKKHAEISEITAFIQSGLSSDCPVAFLNLHTGKLSDFDGWHWIVLTALESHNERYIATGYDGGRKIKFDLGTWVESTKIGGGFVYLT